MAKKLTDLSGLGNKTASKLQRAGVQDLEALAGCDPSSVADDLSGLSEDRIRGWSKAAERETIVIKTGEEVAQEYDQLTKVSTGIDELDDILQGGWESGFLVAIGGPTGSGKTQLAFQSLGQAVNQLNGRGVYIETERGRYRGNRIREMFNEKTQKQVDKVSAYNLDQQEMAYEAVKDNYSPDELACVVVDSFTARFRMSDRFTSREDLPDRSTVMSRHLTKLDELAATNDVPVLLTCQVMSQPDAYSSAYAIYGGTLMHHMVNFVAMMKGKKGALTDLEINNHPEVEDQEIQLQIADSGLQVP